jgi:hypothetical protein
MYKISFSELIIVPICLLAILAGKFAFLLERAGLLPPLEDETEGLPHDAAKWS